MRGSRKLGYDVLTTFFAIISVYRTKSGLYSSNCISGHKSNSIFLLITLCSFVTASERLVAGARLCIINRIVGCGESWRFGVTGGRAFLLGWGLSNLYDI